MDSAELEQDEIRAGNNHRTKVYLNHRSALPPSYIAQK